MYIANDTPGSMHGTAVASGHAKVGEEGEAREYIV